jgi:ribosome-interacting GTPase 1
VSVEFLNQLAREPNTAVMSCELDLGVQDVVDRCWEDLRLMRIYTKRFENLTTASIFVLYSSLTIYQERN